MSAWAHGAGSELAVRDLGGAEVASGQIKSTGLEVDFTTGDKSTTVVIVCRDKSEHGIAYFDDVKVTEK